FASFTFPSGLNLPPPQFPTGTIIDAPPNPTDPTNSIRPFIGTDIVVPNLPSVVLPGGPNNPACASCQVVAALPLTTLPPPPPPPPAPRPRAPPPPAAARPPRPPRPAPAGAPRRLRQLAPSRLRQRLSARSSRRRHSRRSCRRRHSTISRCWST